MFLKRAVLASLAVLFLSACASKVPVTIADSSAVAEAGNAEELLSRLAARPLAPGKTGSMPKQPLAMPRAGSTNAFGMAVTPALEKAYDAHFAGDGAAALAALDSEPNVTALPVKDRWHRSSLRAQVLIMMGRSADAEAELDRSAALEKEAFGRDIFTRALRGEVMVWLGEYDRAVNVLAPVAADVADWRLPTSYGGPPTNLDELVWVTTAQLRTYTALAGQYLLRGEISKALVWAQRAEVLYGDVHYVAGHPLYGPHLKVYADSYYGRALNQTFLAAAQVVTSEDTAAGTAGFGAADAYYDAVGYQPGKVMTQAMRAWAALAAGDVAIAESEAAVAVDLAVSGNFADLVWRVQALRGEALLTAGQTAEAEAAFRSADAAVNAVSGALTSDRAKRRFGIGKEDLTYRLVQFDLAKGDMETLLTDLEQGRARAFVDMVAGRAIATGRGGVAARRLPEIDAEIRRLRLINASGANADMTTIEVLVDERARIVDELAARDPDLADAYAVMTTPLRQIRESLPKGRALLYSLPARGADQLKFLAVMPDSATRVLEARVSAEALGDLLDRFTDAVALADSQSQEGTADDIKAALAVDAWPEEASSFYVVPSGDLFFVPWGAIMADSAVAVLPTGSWAARSRSGGPGGAVVVGDPAFGGTLQQLPGARAEARQVADMYAVNPLVGDDATPFAVRQAVGSGVGTLHLATHGRFDAAYPLRSALYFAGADGRAMELTAADLYESPLAADVVVLSACETGAGRAEAGDDFLGLVRSFYLGGSRTVVNSLWPVDDAGTQIFMEAFHKSLKDGDAGTAWLAARDATKAAGLPPAVYGAFVLGGLLNQ